MRSDERRTARRRSGYRSITEILVCVAAFALVGYAFSPLDILSALQLDPGPLLCGMVFWVGWHLREGESEQWTGFVLVEQLSIGGGLALVLQACVAYSNLMESVPLPIVLGGSLTSGVLLAALHPWLYPRHSGAAVLLIGCDGMGKSIAAALYPQPVGAIEQDPARVPAGIPFLGHFSDAPAIVNSQRPGRIVVDTRHWAAAIAPRFLLDCKLAGITVEEAANTYQRLFLRVSLESLRPSELLWSPMFYTNRLAMAAQTIYSNLAGLTGLVLTAPVLAVVAIVSGLAAGPGPMLERTMCAGFQGIPFAQFRFRTRRSKTGETTWIGAVIERLRLTNLPQIINIVRGEMALFGPQPVRTEFAARMAALIPFYMQKLRVKPGLFGWAQVHSPGAKGIHEESLRLEYDIYYLTQCSPSLDLEILVRTLLGARRAAEPVVVR